MNMIRNMENRYRKTARTFLSLLFALILLIVFLPIRPVSGEAIPGGDVLEEDDWGNSFVILDDPEAFMPEDEEIPVITSVGKTNVKVNGVKSKNKLLRYTIPEQLLAADPQFLALMVEAEKYIGYPYVYGESNPDKGFDCSGFVCWVFSQSGVYRMDRHGANGLYGICQDIPMEEARPGDLVFFEKTMGSAVKGITHVGIYVGNNMMIHAGDPVGFADLKSDKWARKIYAFGRLPINGGE